MRTLLDYHTVLQEHDPVGKPCRAQPVGYEQDGLVARELEELAVDLHLS